MKDDTEPAFETKRLPEDYDELAPDKSEIRPLLSTKGAGLAHCTLPPHGISLAVKHKRVEEIWYFIQGHGQVWRKQGDREEIVDVGPGICLTIPPETHFQFRNTDKEPLCFIIATMPPWPGEQEAIPVPGYWEMDSAL